MKFPAADFFMGIVFGIIFPLIDMVTDGYLFYNTLTFKGGSMGMAGCRSCYNNGVAPNYKDLAAGRECDVCAVDMRYDFGGLYCGAIPPALDKMTELLKSKSCLQNGTAWRMRYDSEKNITIEQSDACEVEDDCCITTPTKYKSDSMTNDMNRFLPDSTNWHSCSKYNDGECEFCFGYGAIELGVCHDLLLDDDAFYYNEVLSCTDGYYVATQVGKRFERNNKGCAREDGCCVHIASNRSSFDHDNYFRCNDPCRLHINHLSTKFKTIYDWTSWSKQSGYIYGGLLGGKLCSTSVTFAYCLLIPILLNWLFVLKVWFSDLTNKRTTLKTFVFGVTATYPIILVVKYLWNWKNAEKMKQEKARFEHEVATAEGFLESILQVSEYLPIILELPP